MIRKRLMTMAVAVLSFLGLALAMAPSAQAADFEDNVAERRDYSSYAKECVAVSVGKACVQPYGDILWLRDLKVDGLGLYLTWKDLDGDRWGQCRGGGVDRGWLACNKNFPEGHEIRWYLVYYNSDGTLHTTGYVYTTV